MNEFTYILEHNIDAIPVYINKVDVNGYVVGYYDMRYDCWETDPHPTTLVAYKNTYPPASAFKEITEAEVFLLTL